MNNKIDKILAEISAGELIDKITILEIKKDKILNESKAKEIIKKGEQDREKLQKKIDTKFNSAVKDVKKKIIGV